MNREVAWALTACPILPTSLISRNYVSVDVKHHERRTKKSPFQVRSCVKVEVAGLSVPNSPYGLCGRNATAEEELFDKTVSRMHYVMSKGHVVGPVTNWQQLGNNPSRNVPEEHSSDCKCFR